MKCDRGELLKALDLVKYAIDASAGATSEGSFTIDCEVGTEDGRLIIVADDLKTRIRASIFARGELDHTVVPIASRKFVVAKSRLKDSRPAAPKQVGEENVVAWPSEQFESALRFVSRAQSLDETRFHLCSVLFDDAKLISTDGHRMHIADGVKSFEGGDVLFQGTKALLAALKAISPEFVFGRVFRRPSDDLVEFSLTGSGVTLLIQERSGRSDFPPWRQVVPKEFENTFAIDTALLSESVATALKVAKATSLVGMSTKERAIKFTVNGDLTVSANSGAFSEKLRLETEADLEETFYASGVYMTDAMLGGPAVVKLCGELSPITIEYGNRRAVVMPVRGD
jgi:DNA polymerase III sliding clamp (beta) subunit (PCNA family)